MGKLAIKRLTSSDLTLFEPQFRTLDTGNQKSINLNANVFIDALYPALPDTDVGRVGRIPLDLFIFGPGHAQVWNLQRKIIKGGSYKNWRLNGEFISNPIDSPNRFDSLSPGDFAIFEFEGELYPFEARLVLIAAALPEDANLHAGILDYGVRSMAAIELANLRLIVHASGTPEHHPVNELLLDAAIEDAAQHGLMGTQRVLSRRSGRRLSRTELERSRQRAAEVGREGEEFIDGFFALEMAQGRLDAYEWTAADNAISPFDFTIQAEGVTRKIEVKSTNGDFNQVMHVSFAELLEMERSEERYDLYRIYALDETQARLRIAANMKDNARRILSSLGNLPSGVSVDSISLLPSSIAFSEEKTIELPLDEIDTDTESG